MGRSPVDGKTKKYAPGDLLTKEMEISRKLFIIKKGRVQVFKEHLGQKVVLATLGEGEIFGELSFIEASPRSASVEALTAVEAHVVDVDDVTSQLEKLPDWIVPIFKTVFARLRAADKRTVELHGLNGFERRHFGRDSLTEKTYADLLKANRLLNFAYSESKIAGRHLRESELSSLFDEFFGEGSFNLSLLLKVMKDLEIVDPDLLDKDKRIVLDVGRHESWVAAWHAEIASKRYLRLTDRGFDALRGLHNFVLGNWDSYSNIESSHEYALAEFGSVMISFTDDALAELVRSGVVKSPVIGRISFSPAAIRRTFSNQVILKLFAPELRAKAA